MTHFNILDKKRQKVSNKIFQIRKRKDGQLENGTVYVKEQNIVEISELI